MNKELQQIKDALEHSIRVTQYTGTSHLEEALALIETIERDYVLVPREPTMEMFFAIKEWLQLGCDCDSCAKETYKAMIKAAEEKE